MAHLDTSLTRDELTEIVSTMDGLHDLDPEIKRVEFTTSSGRADIVLEPGRDGGLMVTEIS